jgi:hypothetical protein
MHNFSRYFILAILMTCYSHAVVGKCYEGGELINPKMALYTGKRLNSGMEAESREVSTATHRFLRSSGSKKHVKIFSRSIRCDICFHGRSITAFVLGCHLVILTQSLAAECRHGLLQLQRQLEPMFSHWNW